MGFRSGMQILNTRRQLENRVKSVYPLDKGLTTRI